MSNLEGMPLHEFWTHESRACELMATINADASLATEFPAGITTDPQDIYVRQSASADAVHERASYMPLSTWVRRVATDELTHPDEEVVQTVAVFLAAKIATAAASQESQDA
jgi:hypothetical protein